MDLLLIAFRVRLSKTCWVHELSCVHPNLFVPPKPPQRIIIRCLVSDSRLVHQRSPLCSSSKAPQCFIRCVVSDIILHALHLLLCLFMLVSVSVVLLVSRALSIPPSCHVRCLVVPSPKTMIPVASLGQSDRHASPHPKPQFGPQYASAQSRQQKYLQVVPVATPYKHCRCTWLRVLSSSELLFPFLYVFGLLPRLPRCPPTRPNAHRSAWKDQE